jgi:hypothetical protein
MSGNDELQIAIELLSHRHSRKRKSGARRLRKLQDSRAGPALLLALKAELRDRRTWEPQYEMISALGECGHTPARELIEALMHQEFEATRVFTGIGDALVRLAPSPRRRIETALNLIGLTNPSLANGALKGLAGVRAIPERVEIDAIIDYAMGFPVDEARVATPHRWVAQAAAGWLQVNPRVAEYLTTCVASDCAGVSWTAEKSLKGEYRKWEAV